MPIVWVVSPVVIRCPWTEAYKACSTQELPNENQRGLGEFPRTDIVYALNRRCRLHVTSNRGKQLPPGVIGFYPEFREDPKPDVGSGITIWDEKDGVCTPNQI